MNKNKWYFFYCIQQIVINFSWLLLIIIPLLFVVNWSIVTVVSAEKETIDTRLVTTAEKEANNLNIFVNSKFEAILDDFKIITNANETSNYLMEQNLSTITEFQLMLKRIATSRTAFLEMQMININGDVIYQITRLDNGTVIESNDHQTNVSDLEYFDIVQQMDATKLYVSPLHLADGKARITLVKPIVNDEHILSLLSVDYEVNTFMSVLNEYTSQESQYLSYGLINQDDLWLFDKDEVTLNLNTNDAYQTAIDEQMQEDKHVVDYVFTLDTNDFYVNSDNHLRFYIQLDVEQAILDSGFFLINHMVSVFIFSNIIAIGIVGLIAYFIRKKRDSSMIVHANMYLSSQNTDSIVIVNEKLRVTYVNPAFEQLFGYTLVNIHLKDIKSVIGVSQLPLDYHGNQKVDYIGHNWQRIKTGIYILSYLRIKREDFFAGQEYYIGIYSKPKIVFDDYQNYQDNKAMILKHFTRFVEAYPFIINQTCLIMIAVRNTDVVAFAHYLQKHLESRYVIAIPHQKHVMIYVNVKPEQYQHMIYRIEELIESYRYLPTTSRYFSHIFVVAKSDEKVDTPKQLVDAMITTLIFAKAHPRQTHHIYHNQLKQEIEREKAIENELDQAFIKREFYLNYQVQMDLKTEAFVAAEALLRWDNEKLGVISPAEFIPIIEKSFYINKLSLMVVDLLIEDLKTIIDDLPADFRVAINLCEFDFSNDYIIDQLLTKIDQSPIASSHFVFEITETQYIDNVERTNQIIDLFHEKDILIAIDDFGTGYSSINLLKSINFDFVKVDRLFIKDYPDTDDGQMFDTIVNLIRGLNKIMIVEGVELQKQLEFCKTYECDLIQGYLISKPVPFQSFIKQII